MLIHVWSLALHRRRLQPAITTGGVLELGALQVTRHFQATTTAYGGRYQRQNFNLSVG